MSNHIGLSPELSAYILKHTPESPLAKKLREETALLPQARMITTADQANFLGLLVKLMNVKTIIEIGTFTGYSSLAMAGALPKDGRLIALDSSTEFTNVARRYWKEAGVEDRIELKLAPAQQSLGPLLKTHAGQIDLIFIDADKTGYDGYYEASLTLLRQGGLVLFDNMLWHGDVADPANQERDTVALRQLNAKIAADSRVDASLLTVADGMMLARKR